MSVVVLVPSDWDSPQLIRWAAHFAIAQKKDLVALLMTKRSDKETQTPDLFPEDGEKDARVLKLKQAIGDRFDWTCPQEEEANEDPSPEVMGDAPEDEPVARLRFHARQLSNSDPLPGATAALKEFSASLLIVPRHNEEDRKAADFAFRRDLMTHANCATLLLCPGQHDGREIKKLLVPTSAAPQGQALLECASTLGNQPDRDVTAVYVQRPVDEVARSVGERALAKAMERSWKNRENVRPRVVLNANPVDGIREVIKEESCDLMLLGASYNSLLHRVWVNDVTEQLIRGKDAPPIAVIRQPIPISSRLRRGVEKTLRDGVPQLARKDRVELVERVQTNSVWNFDFIALMCLSTLIAGCGLLLNSGAVVIGAMLVAPLMTPLLGSGLSLVQGNSVLLKNTVNSVAGGFCLAFVISLLLGLLMQIFTGDQAPTLEMLGRGNPGFLDLIVALVSGVAAAYATSRPNLLGALPGVAIAAALVPPIATSGLAFAMGEYGLSTRAALLFFTNIVAIVLGTAGALWAVGIRSYHAHGLWDNWSRWITVLLAVVVSLLIVWFVIPHHQVPLRLSNDFKAAVKEYDAELVDVDYSRKEDTVRVVIRAASAPGRSLANRFVEQARKIYTDNTSVQVETRLFVESNR